MFKTGDWVKVEGYGKGYITDIDDWGCDELEYEVRVFLRGKWQTKSAYEEDIQPLPLEVDKSELLEMALAMKDFDWCKELMSK